MKDNTVIHLFCDGSSLGNPGVGGYGVLILNASTLEVLELGGRKQYTTNNEMEMSALIAGLSVLSFTSELPLYLYIDSQYVLNGITNWMYSWQKSGWIKKDNEPIKNLPLWKQLYSLIDPLKKSGRVEFFHIYGHTGQKGNERVDTIAQSFSRGIPEGLRKGFFHNYNILLSEYLPKEKTPYIWSASKKASNRE